jgi:glycosyltransferase involved in cell wall biosynthesis
MLFVGRLEPIKGVSTLLSAFKLCNQNLHLKIIGDGSQRNYLESLSKGLNVSFLGMCNEVEIKWHLRNSKALILPSLSENFPNVILEAFCAGIPVIASNVGAIPELIEDGINGFLFHPTKTAELSEKIKVLFANDERLNQMGLMSYQKVRIYNWPNLVERFSTIIAN